MTEELLERLFMGQIEGAGPISDAEEVSLTAKTKRIGITMFLYKIL